MLQIKNISKTYKTGPFVQKALDKVSFSLRDSEFVAVLGQSGSGKTTLLNVIGGLDRYDEGDLIINGKSTKKYKNRDWDAYRNHSVGFVFQSYNLIPHQTVLANVELALTIGGISKKERVERAKRALCEVGLEDHMHKKPSQLSGGQMQRVAIARALVNDPDILLADEPTGALDSDTSIQVMDLLKKVAKDRLVVMVTHNPELAEQYATRIIRLKDGKIIADSDPFEPEGVVPETHRAGKSSMSFITALNLSLKNLWTKKVRTLLVAFAGSIGIIGIAMILSMSNGANLYIRNIQEETLKSYPLQITQTSFDLSSLITPAVSAATDAPVDENSGDAPVREWRTVTNLFSHVANNDLRGLKDYFESGETDVYDYVQAIEYDYNITPQIFLERGDTIRQVNPDRSFAALGFSATDTMSSLMTSFSGTSSFYAMPSDPDLYLGQYDVKAGRWPESPNECVVVLSEKGYIADLTLYTLGIKDPAELDDMIKAFAEGYSSDVTPETKNYDYDEFLGINFKVVVPASWYTYDSEYKVWADRSGDERFMKELVEKSENLTVVGVVQPAEGNTTPFMQLGIAYPASLTLHLIDEASETEIVKSQLADKSTDVFSGAEFGEDSTGAFDLSSLFNIDADAFKGIFDVDASSFDLSSLSFDLSSLDLSSFDLSSMIDPSAFDGVSLPDMGSIDLASLIGKLKIKASEEDIEALFGEIMKGFIEYAAKDPTTDYTKLPQSIGEFLMTDEARTTVSREIGRALSENGAELITPDDLGTILADVMADFPDYVREHSSETLDVATLLSDYLALGETREKLQGAAGDLRARIEAFIIKPEQYEKIASALISSYNEYSKNNGLPDLSSVGDTFAKYLSSDEAASIITKAAVNFIDTSEVERAVSDMMANYTEDAASVIGGAIESSIGDVAASLESSIGDMISSAAANLSTNLESYFNFDPAALSDAVELKMSPEELRDVITSVLSGDSGNYETNLRKLGYADTGNPSIITIYPADFNGKTSVKNIIETYNDRMRAAGNDEKVIIYTDLVDALMGSVTDIIDAISYILIAFVAISLVVSSVMIGVITYISVLERKKEIGILRAIGASKRNVSNVFNAETFIIGALAGVLGIAITLLLLIPANYAIHALSGQSGINAVLPPAAGGILILLSIGLTMLGGLIPSRKAAKSDPVEALRSE